MLTRTLLVALLTLGVDSALAAPAHSSAAAPPVVRIAEFADVGADAIPEDGGVTLMQRNNGSGRVQIVVISRDLHLTKTSWTDRPGARADVQTATRAISAEDQRALRAWMDQLWGLAASGAHGHLTYAKQPPGDDGKPGFLFAFVVRRGSVVRVVDVGAGGTRRASPDWLDGVVDYMEMEF